MNIEQAAEKLAQDLRATEGRTAARIEAAAAERDRAVAKAEATMRLAVKAAGEAHDRLVRETQDAKVRTTRAAVEQFDQRCAEALGLADRGFVVRRTAPGRLELTHGAGGPLLATATAERGGAGWCVEMGGERSFLGGSGDGAEISARGQLWRAAMNVEMA